MASSKQSTAVAFVLVFLIISLGGKEAEAIECHFLETCLSNQECVPACSANGYLTGLCTTNPPTGNNYCCCIS
ncbi:hypothetical protein CK203_010718 [Vitis vinifera]|uniref:Uncharacterized protein n=1 Tax=Vitis vinifera TaxID=29760 RepID=A0A438JTL0_VITVI|nr:hypothetical protein CK203_010718 [Vitis vinifera]